MPVESDSPDHGGGNPTLPDAALSPPPPAGDRSGGDAPPSGEAARPLAHEQPGTSAPQAAEGSTAPGPVATQPAPAPGRATGLGDNGQQASGERDGSHGGGAGPGYLTGPPPLPYAGPPEAMPGPPATDPAAGLPAPPAHYRRAGPTVVSQLRRRRGRRGRRRAAPAVEGRRVVHRLRRVSPWSVFKVAVLFYICVFLMFMVASVLLWKIGRSTETVDQVEGLVTRLGAYGRCVPESEVEPGTEFASDDDCPEGEVIVDGFRFNDGTLFRAELLAGAIFVVAGTALTVLMVILLNLLNDVTGGVRYETLRETPAERAGGAVAAVPAPVAAPAEPLPGPAPPAPAHAPVANPVPPPSAQRSSGFGLPPSR